MFCPVLLPCAEGRNLPHGDLSHEDQSDFASSAPDWRRCCRPRPQAPASAYVACNRDGDCWHSETRVRAPSVRFDYHPDDWYFHQRWDNDATAIAAIITPAAAISATASGSRSDIHRKRWETAVRVGRRFFTAAELRPDRRHRCAGHAARARSGRRFAASTLSIENPGSDAARPIARRRASCVAARR